MRTAIRLLPAFLLLAFGSSLWATDLDEVVKHMNATSESIKDVQATAKVTRYDSVFEETRTSARKLFFQRPHLARVDTFETRRGKEVLTQQFILGKDFTLQVWPETRHGEKRLLSPEEIDSLSRDRNDPISFFARNIDDIRKDFNLELAASPAGTPTDSVVLVITPANKEVQFDYAKVVMVIDAKTWLPRSIKSFVGADTDDWTLYEFTDIKVNPGLKPSTFEAPAGIDIETIQQTKPAN